MSGRDMAEEGKELLLDDEGCTDSEAESQTDLLQVSAPSGPARFKGLFVSRRVVAPSTAGAAEEYRLYPWRWFMLACICLINVSNGAVRRHRTLWEWTSYIVEGTVVVLCRCSAPDPPISPPPMLNQHH